MIHTDKSQAETFAFVFGLLYVFIALIGFAITGFSDFFSKTGDELIIFELNPLHNIAHLGIGGLLMWASDLYDRSRIACLIVGVVYLVIAVAGFAGVVVDTVLSVNAADNALHLATAFLALYFGSTGS